MRKVNKEMTINNLKEINVKNWTYYYLDDLINVNFLDFRNIGIDKKLYKNIFMYYFRYKTPYTTKPFPIIFIK